MRPQNQDFDTHIEYFTKQKFPIWNQSHTTYFRCVKLVKDLGAVKKLPWAIMRYCFLKSWLFRLPGLQADRSIFRYSYWGREMVISFMGKKPSVPIGWEAGRALEPTWRWWRRGQFHHEPRLESQLSKTWPLGLLAGLACVIFDAVNCEALVVAEVRYSLFYGQNT